MHWNGSKIHAKSVLPTWMDIERAPKEFDFQQDLKEHDSVLQKKCWEKDNRM